MTVQFNAKGFRHNCGYSFAQVRSYHLLNHIFSSVKMSRYRHVYIQQDKCWNSANIAQKHLKEHMKQ